MADAPRILVIDDSEVILARVRTALAADGYEVVTTTQTVGSARHLRGCELVIVDLHMPGLSGGDVLQSLRAAIPKDTPRPLFYLYTTDEIAAQDYAKMGFDGCFTKKGDVLALVPQVQAALRIARMRQIGARK
jgi:two-component system, OmpR family, response regulator